MWVSRNDCCGAQDAAPPAVTESCRRRFGGGLRNAILAFQPPRYYLTEPS